MIKLPNPATVRWTPKTKAAIVAAIRSGELSESVALVLYDLTPEELGYWMDNASNGGTPALRVTRVQHYRAAFA